MNSSTQHASRRRTFIAAAAGVGLTTVGLVVVLLGIHGSLVCGSTNRAELRLITCRDSVDQKSGHHVDKIDPFAHLVA